MALAPSNLAVRIQNARARIIETNVALIEQGITLLENICSGLATTRAALSGEPVQAGEVRRTA